MKFWGRSVQGPSVELQRQLDRSQQQLDDANARNPKVMQTARWFDARYEENGFGRDLRISYTRKERHA